MHGGQHAKQWPFKPHAPSLSPWSRYPAYLHITDIAGLVRGAAEGAGLGNAFLSHISAVDGIFHVVRAFDSSEVVHVDDSVDPVRDLETIQVSRGAGALKGLGAGGRGLLDMGLCVILTRGRYLESD